MLPGRAAIPALLAALALHSSTAEATGPYGPELAIKVGYALPFGDAYSTETTTASLDQTVRSLMPFGAELGYRLSGLVGVGLYADYATASVDDLCPPGSVDCSVERLRAGLYGSLHFNSDSDVDPWLSLGVGYEELALFQVSVPEDTNTVMSGLQFGAAQAGLNFLGHSSPVAFGPFAELAVGQFSTRDVLTASATTAEEIQTTLHYWVEFGIKVSFLIDFRSDAEKQQPLEEPAETKRKAKTAEFAEPMASRADGAAAPEQSFVGGGSEGMVLLGARRDLHYQGERVESCECLAVAVGHADDSRFWWDCGAPLLNPSTQLAFAFSADGVPCATAPKGTLGASYAGYSRDGDDIIVEIENARPGYPVVEGAIIPRPAPGGAVYVRPRRGVVYGRPKGLNSGQCRVVTVRGP